MVRFSQQNQECIQVIVIILHAFYGLNALCLTRDHGGNLRVHVSKNQTFSNFRGHSSKIDFAQILSRCNLLCL